MGKKTFSLDNLEKIFYVVLLTKFEQFYKWFFINFSFECF